MTNRLLSTEQTEFKNSRIAKTIGYYVAFIALGLAAAVIGPTLSGLAAHTGTTLGAISFLFTASSLGYMLGSLQGGRLFDRMPGHPVLVAVLLTMALMLAVAPLVPWLWLLAVVVLCIGAGQGMLDVGANTLLVWVHGDGAAPFMNGLHFFFGIGALITPLIVAQSIVLSGDINWAFWVLALLTLPGTAWLARLPSPPHHLEARNGGTLRVNRGLVLLISVFFFLYVGAEASFGGWIFTYATRAGVTTEVVAALLTSAFWGALTVGRLVAIPIASRFSPPSILAVDILGTLMSVAVVLLWPYSLAAVWAGTLGTGLAMASIFPLLLSFAGQRMTITASASSWFFVGSGAGGMCVPWLIGQLFEPAGPPVSMAIILSCELLYAAVFGVMMLNSHKT